MIYESNNNNNMDDMLTGAVITLIYSDREQQTRALNREQDRKYIRN